jgi:hypothetical protein
MAETRAMTLGEESDAIFLHCFKRCWDPQYQFLTMASWQRCEAIAKFSSDAKLPTVSDLAT